MSNVTKTPRNLRHVAVRGFKSIKELDLDMGPVNILIGANGAGKSNFISLFTFLSRLSLGQLRTYVEQQGFADTFFHFGSKNTPTIEVDLEVAYNGYHVAFVQGADDTLVIKSELCVFVPALRAFRLSGKNGESGLLPGSVTRNESVRDSTREYLQRCRVYHFHDTGSSAGFKKAQRLSASDYLYQDAANLAPFLYRLMQEEPNSYREIVSAVQTVAPFFQDFVFEPRGPEGEERLLLKWRNRNDEHPFSAAQISDGTARFICLATLFLQPPHLSPDTIVLDEPELGLHPAALVVLAELIQSAARERQVICSTQSVALANLFAPEDFIVVDQVKGVSTFRRPDPGALRDWLEDYGMGDLWSKNLIGGRPEW